MLRAALIALAALAGAAAGGPKNANCVHAGMPYGGPCDVGHEQCCSGAPGALCPFRNFTKPAAVFHLGNTQGCGENDPNGPFYDPVRRFSLAA